MQEAAMASELRPRDFALLLLASPAVAPRQRARGLRDLLPALRPVDPAPALAVTPEHARARLTAGTPLLRGERLVLDPAAFRERWRRACEALQAQQPDGVALALADAVRTGRLD